MKEAQTRIPGAKSFLAGLGIFIWCLCVFMRPCPASASCLPVTVTVANNQGDNSSGSLGDAINQVNANGSCGGVINLSGISGQTISLSAGLPTLAEGVTILNSGTPVMINAVNGSNTYQVFNVTSVPANITGVQVNDGSLIGTGNVSASNGTLQFNGSSNSGNPVTVSSSSLTVSNSTLGLNGGSGTPNGGAGGAANLNVSGNTSVDPSTVTITGGNGTDNNSGDGGAGGAATATIGSLNLAGDLGGPSTYQVTGGNGGNATGGIGNGGAGGDGIFTSSGAVSIDSSDFSAGGGGGGSSFTSIGGNGGNANVSIGTDLNITASKNLSMFAVVGGLGGVNNGTGIGGNGGTASLPAGGAVSVDSSIVGAVGGSAVSGNGSAGTTEGSGGNASASLGSLTVTSDNYNLNGIGTPSEFLVMGGAGGNENDLGSGGTGGSADLSTSNAVSVDSSSVSVGGGVGGASYGGNGGNGGNASVSIGSDLIETASNVSSGLNVTGGNSGNNIWNYGHGTSGTAGSAALSVSGAVSVDSSSVSVTGGNAGYGYGLGGTTGGAGGNASASLGSLKITSDNYNLNGIGNTSNFNVSGGTGGTDYYQGAGGDGGSAALSVAGAVSVDSSDVNVDGGKGGYSYYANGGNGGDATVFVGSNLTVTGVNNTSNFTVVGGASAGNYQGNSGVGGDAALSVVDAVSVDSSNVSVGGGTGMISAYGNGDNGGNVSVSIGSNLSVNNSSNLNVTGGSAEIDYPWINNGSTGAGGSGGSAALSAVGAVPVDSSGVTVAGGTGADSYGGNGGNGGSASVSIGSGLTVTASNDSSSLYVAGGNGGNNYDWYGVGTGGTGGSSSLSVAGAVSVDSSDVNVAGGYTGYGYGSGSSVTEGAGGNASASLGGLTLTSDNYNQNGTGTTSNFTVVGRAGGDDYGNGNGGNGGSASLSVSDAVSVDSSSVSVAGGTGGYSAGANGGNGGNASVSIGTSLTLMNASNLVLSGGAGGNNNTGGNGGNGGDASLTASGLTLGAGTIFSMTGGAGGSGDSNDGSMGNANAVVGTLNGAGYITMGGSTANLQVKQGYFSGVIAGNESLDVTGGGALTLTGSNTYSGGTTMDSGTLNLGNNNALGTGNLTLEDGTTLQAGVNNLAVTNAVSLSGTDTYDSNSDNSSLSGVISGTGSLTKINAGALTLASANTYSGGTTVVSGALNLGNNNALGTGNLALENGATLQAGVNNLAVTNGVSLNGADTLDKNGYDSSLSGVLSGTGSLDVIGGGTVTLAGSNTYSGGTNLNGGTLVVANSNALGTGSVVNGGILSINGPMTVNIGGNYTQSSSGILQLGMGGTAAGTWDVLNVSGAASLNGTLWLVSDNGFHLHIHGTEDFEILSAGSVGATFTTFSDMITGDSVSLVYQSKDVLLKVTGPSFQSLGGTPNEAAVGGVLDYLNAHSPDQSLIHYLNTQSDAALLGIYDKISPADLTPLYRISFSSAQVEAGMVEQRLDQLFGNSGDGSKNISWNGEELLFAGRHSARREANMAKDLQPEHWGVFADGIGDFGTVSADSNAPGYQYSTGGMVAGMDYRFSKDLVGGLMLGYTQSGSSQSTGTVNVTGGQLGLYGGWKQGPLHVEALAAGGINSYTTQRDSLGGTASGSTQGQQLSGQIGAGYDLTVGNAKVVPFVSGQYTRVDVNGFNEFGSQTPLNYAAQGEGCLTSDLGAGVSRDWFAGNVVLAPSVSAAWEHVFQGNLDSLDATLGSGGSFTVDGPATGTDALVLAAGLDAQFTKGFKAYVSCQGRVGLTNFSGQNLTGGVNFGF